MVEIEDRKEPSAARTEDKSSTDKPAAKSPPKPKEPDPEEVQYPGYFKDGGSL